MKKTAQPDNPDGQRLMDRAPILRCVIHGGRDRKWTWIWPDTTRRAPQVRVTGTAVKTTRANPAHPLPQDVGHLCVIVQKRHSWSKMLGQPQATVAAARSRRRCPAQDSDQLDQAGGPRQGQRSTHWRKTCKAMKE